MLRNGLALHGPCDKTAALHSEAGKLNNKDSYYQPCCRLHRPYMAKTHVQPLNTINYEQTIQFQHYALPARTPQDG